MEIGDRVITITYVDPHPEGKIGTILDVYDDGGVFDCYVEFDGGGTCLYYFHELVQIIPANSSEEIKEIDWV